jgi:hypothetical protein
MDWNTMSPARQKAAQSAAFVDVYLTTRGKTSITMTEATTAIWGTSGTGNPNAVRIIEACAAYGFLKITPQGKRARYISVVAGKIPAEAMSDKDRAYFTKQYHDDIRFEVEQEAERMKRNIEAATTPQAKTDAFLGGVAAMLSTGTRRR